MIKVLEHGVRKVTCPNCKAKLQYEQEDIITEKTPGGKRYIICPDCNSEIVLNKTKYERDVESYLDLDV